MKSNHFSMAWERLKLDKWTLFGVPALIGILYLVVYTILSAVLMFGSGGFMGSFMTIANPMSKSTAVPTFNPLVFGLLYLFSITASIFMHSGRLTIDYIASTEDAVVPSDYFSGFLTCPLRLLGLAAIGLGAHVIFGIVAVLATLLTVAIHGALAFLFGLAAFALILFLITRLFTVDLHLVADDAGPFEAIRMALTFTKGKGFEIWGFIGTLIAIGLGVGIIYMIASVIGMAIHPAAFLVIYLGILIFMQYISAWIGLARMYFYLNHCEEESYIEQDPLTE